MVSGGTALLPTLEGALFVTLDCLLVTLTIERCLFLLQNQSRLWNWGGRAQSRTYEGFKRFVAESILRRSSLVPLGPLMENAIIRDGAVQIFVIPQLRPNDWLITEWSSIRDAWGLDCNFCPIVLPPFNCFFCKSSTVRHDSVLGSRCRNAALLPGVNKRSASYTDVLLTVCWMDLLNVMFVVQAGSQPADILGGGQKNCNLLYPGLF